MLLWPDPQREHIRVLHVNLLRPQNEFCGEVTTILTQGENVSDCLDDDENRHRF